MSLTKVFLLIILHFLAYSLFLYVNAFLWKPIFLMGSFKKNYKEKPQNLQDMETRIRHEIEEIPPNWLQNSLQVVFSLNI
jgi:hypothetical protein